jgi:hypothetical protein
MSERNVYIPPEYVEGEKSIIFLAGPIQGAPDWQSKAQEIIHGINPLVTIASPKRPFNKNLQYNEQADWETYHLRKAGQNGVIIFWLAKEETHVCERAYAQTTRAELFEWKVRHERDGAKIVIGIEEGFSGTRYIKRRFSQDCSEVPILDSLEETCKKALEML